MFLHLFAIVGYPGLSFGTAFLFQVFAGLKEYGETNIEILADMAFRS
jgi:hypothetical protein